MKNNSQPDNGRNQGVAGGGGDGMSVYDKALVHLPDGRKISISELIRHRANLITACNDLINWSLQFKVVQDKDWFLLARAALADAKGEQP